MRRSIRSPATPQIIDRVFEALLHQYEEQEYAAEPEQIGGVIHLPQAEPIQIDREGNILAWIPSFTIDLGILR